jgi:hypothetical protein
LQAGEIGQAPVLGNGGQKFLRAHVKQLGAGGEARAVITVRSEDGVIDIHLLREAVEGSPRRMNSGGNTLPIIGSESLLATGDVEHRRIKLLVESFGKRFAEPFQAGRRGRIFEWNHDHGLADNRATGGSGNILRAKRQAEQQRS